MLRAFHYDLATTPRLLRISAPDGRVPQEHSLRDASATLAGLVATRRVAPGDCSVSPDTGELVIIERTDPLGDSRGT